MVKKRKPVFNLHLHTVRKTPFVRPKSVGVSLSPKSSSGIIRVPVVVRSPKVRIKPVPIKINFASQGSSGITRRPKVSAGTKTLVTIYGQRTNKPNRAFRPINVSKSNLTKKSAGGGFSKKPVLGTPNNMLNLSIPANKRKFQKRLGPRH